MKIAFIVLVFFLANIGYAQQNANTIDHASAFEVTYESTKVYPNPVVSNAVFEFKLPNTSRVQVSMLNILGAQIKNFVNETRAAGKQTIPFSADQFQRGTYFIRLTINGEIVKTVRVAVSPQWFFELKSVEFVTFYVLVVMPLGSIIDFWHRLCYF